jgi:hypothetical protein
MQAMSPLQWEDCMNVVLLPLLSRLAHNISPMDPIGTEESRVRAIALVNKVLLNHLM